MTSEPWPALPYDAWKDTYETLHLWTQVVGKVALALAPPLNHSCGVAFHLTARGLTTLPLLSGDRTFTMEFDFVDHRLVVATSDGHERVLGLGPMTVADFYAAVMELLAEMGIRVRIRPMSTEIPSPVRLDRDVAHRSYDLVFANRFWRILARAADVLTRERCAFVGKCSPALFFWGSFDLAITRFSGRRAPDREGPAFMRDAYSHEVISHGFWPGGGPVLEPVFYAYAAPEPPGFREARIAPEAAFYHRELGEFLLPYEAVRTAASPEAALAAFVTSTYEAGADLGGWDRAALERRR